MVKSKVSYFYVLWCKDRSFYAGYTTDLKRREKEHNEGIGAKYTRPVSRRPLKMIYAETFASKIDRHKMPVKKRIRDNYSSTVMEAKYSFTLP